MNSMCSTGGDLGGDLRTDDLDADLRRGDLGGIGGALLGPAPASSSNGLVSLMTPKSLKLMIPLKSRDEPVWVLGDILDGLMGLFCDEGPALSPGAEELDRRLLGSIGLRSC
jgi:hypothetical protein